MALISDEFFLSGMDYFKIHHMLFHLRKFVGHDIEFQSGPVKRLFYDEQCDDIILQFCSGDSDFVFDRDIEYSMGVARSFEMEYPDEFREFLITYIGFKEEDMLTISQENADRFRQLLDGKNFN